MKKDSKGYKERRRRFGSNTVSFPVEKPVWMIVIESLNDTAILTLLILALISLISGLIEDPVNGAIEGGAIFLAVFVISVISSSVEFMQDRLLRNIRKESKELRHCMVIRGRQLERISFSNIVVGDIVILQEGDTVPCDCILFKGEGVKCNEAGIRNALQITGDKKEKQRLKKEMNVALKKVNDLKREKSAKENIRKQAEAKKKKKQRQN